MLLVTFSWWPFRANIRLYAYQLPSCDYHSITVFSLCVHLRTSHYVFSFLDQSANKLVEIATRAGL